MSYSPLKIILPFILIASLSFPAYAMDFKKDAKIAKALPPKPVKIKLKRDGKGEYSWELSGDGLREIIRLDKRLKAYVNAGHKKEGK